MKSIVGISHCCKTVMNCLTIVKIVLGLSVGEN